MLPIFRARSPWNFSLPKFSSCHRHLGISARRKQYTTMSHDVDARRLLDDRGFSGKLIRRENPANLIEKAVRDRIADSYYFKEQCFAINEATLCDRAVEIAFVGGTYGLQKPSPFLCLTFKLLQLVPDRDVILEYLNQKDFKYLTALAAFYIRLTAEDAVEVYKTLEPLLGDYRKLKRRTKDGGYILTYMDQFVDDLLTKNRVCGTSLWKLPQRTVLEDLDQLEVRVSPLGAELDDDDDDDEGVHRIREDERNGVDHAKLARAGLSNDGSTSESE